MLTESSDMSRPKLSYPFCCSCPLLCSEQDFWDQAFKFVLLSQQQNIATLLSQIEEVKERAAASLKATISQAKVLEDIRTKQYQQEASLRQEREDIIKDLRRNSHDRSEILHDLRESSRTVWALCFLVFLIFQIPHDDSIVSTDVSKKCVIICNVEVAAAP
jgi:hypothetical protein